MIPSRKSQITPPQQQAYNSGSNMDEPASEELQKLLADKKRELEEVMQVNRGSGGLGIYFKDLADNLDELSTGAKGIADITRSWHDGFMIMGLTTQENKRKKELFRYVKE